MILRILYGGESMILRIVYSGELGDAKKRIFNFSKNTLVLLSVDAALVSSRTKKTTTGSQNSPSSFIAESQVLPVLFTTESCNSAYRL